MSNVFTAIKDAQDRSRNFLKKYGNGVFPVEVTKLAKKAGVEVQEREFNKDISGLLKRESKDGHPIIIVKASEQPARRRFTIAHELGHYVLHAAGPLYIDSNIQEVYFRDKNSSEANNIEEIQANGFAAELLMPAEDVKEQIKLYKNTNSDTDEIVQKLAKRYDVSVTAMAIRINKLVEVL